MDKSISNRIVLGEITALTLDTSVFERNSLAMESGLLAQLEQFHQSKFQLIIANTVANEVKRHLAKHATDSTRMLRNAIAQTAKHKALGSSTQDELSEIVSKAVIDDEGRAKRRFDDWIDRVGADVIHEVDFASIGDIMRRYESGDPPFAENGEKKNEFPDAVALSTLDGWAKENNTKILAVSQDKDWHRYAIHSQTIIVVEDLADALLTILRLEQAGEPADRLAELFKEGDALGLKASVLEAIRQQIDKIEFSVDADSQFLVEEDGIDAFVKDITIDPPDNNGPSFGTMSHQGEDTVIMITGTASIDIDVNFSFEKFDSVDREYVSMGTAEISDEAEVEFDVLVNLQNDGSILKLGNIELLNTTHHVYFSDLEPTWMSDPSSYDYD